MRICFKRSTGWWICISSGALLTWIAGVFLMLLVAALAIPLLGWINTPAEALRGATAYMLICSVGYIFQSVYNMLSGILRGVGDSRSPLLFVAVSTVVNILGDILLIGVFGLGAAGAAIATVFAQLVCMVFGIVHVKRRGFPFDFHLKSYRLEKGCAKELLRMGIPVALQEVLVILELKQYVAENADASASPVIDVGSDQSQPAQQTEAEN